MWRVRLYLTIKISARPQKLSLYRLFIKLRTHSTLVNLFIALMEHLIHQEGTIQILVSKSSKENFLTGF